MIKVVIKVEYLVVAVAGFLGAITRAALDKAVNALVETAFPLGTLIINLTGCFAMSFFLTLTMKRLKINHKLRLAVGTGFLGAYTTFSAFAVESINLARNHQIWVSLAYVLGTSLGCFAMAWIGVAASKALTTRSNVEVETSE